MRVLVVDDEEGIRHVLSLNLTLAGYVVQTAANGRQALASLQDVDVVLCDIRMPEMDGLAFLGALPYGAPPVIMMTAYGTLDVAVEAMRRGAYDYVAKPFTTDEVVLTLRKLEERERLARERAVLALENARLRERTGEPVEGFVGRSPKLQEVIRLLTRVAPHDTTVLITGESGTGKELLARALHRLSPRRGAPWITLNCAAIPENLLELELFGQERTALSSARPPGALEQAHTGTLFLDEIDHLTLPLQTRLLQVLDDGVIRRGNADVQVDVRIVVASAYPLVPPRFREDLYYRLAVVHLHVPPLRERPEDIPLLVDYFLDGICQRLRQDRPVVPEETMEQLLTCRWPGNMQQLEHALERALLACDNGIIRPGDLPREVLTTPSPIVDPGNNLSIPFHTEHLERRLIEQALAVSGGNKAAAARALDISYKALLYKIRDYGIGS